MLATILALSVVLYSRCCHHLQNEAVDKSETEGDVDYEYNEDDDDDSDPMRRRGSSLEFFYNLDLQQIDQDLERYLFSELDAVDNLMVNSMFLSTLLQAHR